MLSVEFQGIFGFIILVADIWAIVSVVSSQRSTINKVVWVLLILLLPIAGWIIWLFFGPRANST